MSEALLGIKLETALVAWLGTNKGSLLSGVTICGAHGVTEVAPPYLAVLCLRAPKHPDMQVFNGASLPRRAEVQFLLAVNARDEQNAAAPLTYATSAAQWAAELQSILTGSDGKFTQLAADLNPPTSGPDTRTVTGLRIFKDGDGPFISLMDESTAFAGSEWQEMLTLEIDAIPADG